MNGQLDPSDEASRFCPECLAYQWPEEPKMKHHDSCPLATGLHPAKGGSCYVCNLPFEQDEVFVYIDPTAKEAKGADLSGFPACLGCAVYAVILTR